MANENEECSKIAFIEHMCTLKTGGWRTGRGAGCGMGAAMGSQMSWLSDAVGGGGTTIVNLLLPSFRSLLVVRGGIFAVAPRHISDNTWWKWS